MEGMKMNKKREKIGGGMLRNWMDLKIFAVGFD